MDSGQGGPDALAIRVPQLRRQAEPSFIQPCHHQTLGKKDSDRVRLDQSAYRNVALQSITSEMGPSLAAAVVLKRREVDAGEPIARLDSR
eukprot:CAMPEP_0181255176 /NCGR_PEP_ID=MMETSP1096-20121128/49006_1 /TAXON_ID=156174 ORGANISM="Chrysochromulina ericina, Strain CCMP281" /NCGR_SAMPLE_ID=MMETSP1096 /ASSEMBLY_ACC=CAM_ASM_000453 /LENGTH=89 /DNA_ID=CAMNT_0023353279 /DNA_START=535 /DNA_END=802 /DNA_ORIENTATION=+